MGTIQVRSAFYGWKEISYLDTLEWAKWKLSAMTMCKTDEERLELINNRLNGIHFNLSDLSNKYSNEINNS